MKNRFTRFRIRLLFKGSSRAGKRLLASCMAAVMLVTAIPFSAYGAAPRVQVDETMYVNLDYYGKETQMNVVKGCTTNGVTDYTDYGTYEKVINMTDGAQPVLKDGSVTWTFPDRNQRFYYQCTLPEGQMELPWKFDVSYKLNGLEAEPKTLNGASGLVEIHVKATPNKKAAAYFRNNLMLMVAVPADLSKCYSVDAPGAQLQSVGNSSAAVFLALPGEEGDYTVRLGTDSFESAGIVMMMVPGTADAFDHIADLKEAKDTWRESGDELYESFDELLGAFEAMESGVKELQGGMGSLEQGRKVLSASRKALEEGSVQALNDLASLTEQTTSLIPYLETAQNAVTDINDNVRSIYNTMGDMQDELDDLYDRLKSLRNSLETASEQIGAGITQEEQRQIAGEIARKSAQIEELLTILAQMSAGAGASREAAADDWEELEEALEHADSFRYDRESGGQRDDETEEGNTGHKGDVPGKATPGNAASNEREVQAFSLEEDGVLFEEEKTGPSGEPGSGGDNDASFEEWQDELSEYADEVEADLETLPGTAYSADVAALLQKIKEILGSSDGTIAKAGALMQRIGGLCSLVGEAGEDTAKTVNELRSCTDQLVNLLDDSRVLIDTVDSYVPSMLDALGATEEFLNRLSRTMGSTERVLRIVNDTLTAAGDSLDNGTRQTLSGMQSLLGNSLTAIENLKNVRSASRNMKNTLDEQLDKYEEENNFLNMDPEAPLVSFTSGKNPSPHSIQIVLRTDEIDEEALGDDTADLEAASQKEEGPLQRIWNVFVKIVQAVADIFKDR